MSTEYGPNDNPSLYIESLQNRIKELEEQLADKSETDWNKVVEDFKFEYSKQSIEGQIVFNQRILGIFITPFSEMLKDSPNYTEITCGLREAGQPELVVTLQKKGGKTPHTLRKEAEEKAKLLYEALQEVNDHGINFMEDTEVLIHKAICKYEGTNYEE